MAAAGVSREPSDTYFENVSLLLHGDGTNGAQNNTFIAGNGAAQGPFAKEAGAWGVQFDGSGDYLSVADNAALEVGSGDFTIEVFVYYVGPNATNGANIVSKGNTSSFGPYAIGLNPLTGKVEALSSFTGSTWNFVLTSGSALPTNVWTHLAYVRNGNTFTLYVNGISNATTTSSSSLVDNTENLLIGKTNYASTDFPGYISNLRIVKGTAVYTSNFTPSTTPLTAISGTSLLTCQSNVICDNSSNTFAITTYGDAKVTTQSPFSNSGSYNPYSFSGYFSGSSSNDYLTSSDNAAFNLYGSSFTIEGWIFPTRNYTGGQNGFRNIISKRVSGSTNSSWAVMLRYNSNELMFYCGNSNIFYSTSQIQLNAWTHFAWTYDAGTSIAKVYVNGVLDKTVTSYTISVNNSAGISIGSIYDDTGTYSNYGGYISNLRVVKGTAVYTSNFVPSNAPLTAISGTSLLTCQSSTFVDNSPNNFTITVNGNTTVATASNSGLPITRNGNTTQGTFSPYGDFWSNYFDGSGDYLTVPANAAFGFDADFTIEVWVNTTTFSTDTQFRRVVSLGPDGAANINLLFTADLSSASSNVSVFAGTLLVSGTIPVANGAWNHVAVSRSGTSLRLFVNGVQSGSTATTSTNFSGGTTNGVTVGKYPGANGHFLGYISNLRIVKGTAVYTSNFTPSTAPLTAISGTSLLTCQSNRFIDNSSNNFALTVNGDTSVQPFSPFNPTAAYSPSVNGGSGYFDGTTDFIYAADNAEFNFGSGNFTIEFWAKFTGNAASSVGVFGKSGTGFVSIKLEQGTLGTFYLYMSTNGSSWTHTIQFTTAGVMSGAWGHIAIVRNSATVTVYSNGVSVASANLSTSALSNSSDPFVIGSTTTNTGWTYYAPWTGYISNFRVVKGTAVYTSNFTPPTAPLTAITNTSLLCNFTNAGIFDNAMKNDLETVGNAQISTSVKKYGTGSMYFDGSGDALYIPDTPNLKFGTGDFTLEAWVYATATPSAQYAQIIGRTQYGSTGDWMFQITNAMKLTIYINNGFAATSTGAISLNTWTHVAATRSGSSVKLFINGTQDGSGTSSASTENNASGQYTIGADQGADAAVYTGYIDDLRITKGVARYTANFTPPTQAFPNK